MTGPTSSGTLPAHILVADDNEINRKVLARQLDVLGLSCVTVASGAEALAALRDGHFDLLMTDLYMPEMGGAELAKRVRAMSAMPIVLLTARADMQYSEAAPGSPFDAVLIKPTPVDVLWPLLPGGMMTPATSEAAREKDDPPRAFDLSQLDALADHGVDLRAFVQDWSRSIEDDRARIDAFRRQNDPDAVREQLHRLSGAIGLVGARGLMTVLEHASAASPAFMMGALDGLVERVKVLKQQLDERSDMPSDPQSSPPR